MNNHPDSPFDAALLPADTLSSTPEFQHIRRAVHQQFQPSSFFTQMLADELAETLYLRRRLAHIATRALDLRIQSSASQTNAALRTTLAWNEEFHASPALQTAHDQHDHADGHKHYLADTLHRFTKAE